ncbi:hypothetical protein GGI43DRAFT_366258 [Trichoderma evansii]
MLAHACTGLHLHVYTAAKEKRAKIERIAVIHDFPLSSQHSKQGLFRLCPRWNAPFSETAVPSEHGCALAMRTGACLAGAGLAVARVPERQGGHGAIAPWPRGTCDIGEKNKSTRYFADCLGAAQLALSLKMGPAAKHHQHQQLQQYSVNISGSNKTTTRQDP